MFSAHRTRVITSFDPVFNALSVKEVFLIALKFDDIIVFIVLAPAYDAFLLLFEYDLTELSAVKIPQNLNGE